MEAVSPTAVSPDDELLARTRADDRQEFVSLFRSQFEGIYDFVLRVVRDRGIAAVVVEKTWSSYRERTSVDSTRASLYGIARDAALEELRSRKGPRGAAQLEREGIDFTRIAADRLSDPSAVLFDKELIELVWDSAAALTAKDYSLLDLHVRRGLSADELDERLGLNGSAGPRLSRLRESFENPVRSTLLASRVRHICPQLDYELAEFGRGPVTAATRRSVRRHLRECHPCRRTSSRFVSPSEVFAALSPMAPSAGLRERVEALLAVRSQAGRRSSRLRRLACGIL
jgi:DNA-directed RNA polymerase specialized sigma24 family protein